MTRRTDPTTEESESVDDMFQHLSEAKQRDSTPRTTRSKGGGQSKIERLMSQRPDAAVLASNYEVRMQEMVELDKVTHRAGKPWTSAKAGVEAHGRLPVYYRVDGMVTYTGYIEDIVLRPEDESDVPQEMKDHITDDDTYSDFNEKYDTTTYLVSGGKRLDEPFPQSELERIQGGEYIDEDYSYQPAYIRKRDGDFPEF